MNRGRVPKTIEVIIKPPSLSTAIEVLKEREEYKERVRCSACRAPKQWFELKPGDGRCNNCAP